jgi:ABC-type transporter Mla subunit MlaD
MNERTKQFRVGVVVFAMIITTTILILWNSDFSALPFRSKYQVKLLVDQAPGVAANTPVRRRGLPIGRVDSVEDTDDGALITLNIDADKQIKSNESGRIQSSLVGDAIIEFVPTRSPVGAQPVPPDAVVRGIYAPNPMDLIATLQGDLRQTIVSLGNAGEEVARRSPSWPTGSTQSWGRTTWSVSPVWWNPPTALWPSLRMWRPT